MANAAVRRLHEMGEPAYARLEATLRDRNSGVVARADVDLPLAGLLGYVFVYTLWLKRTTPQNIVIGGAAGAVPPLVGWAAATGNLTLAALLLFAIVFCETGLVVTPFLPGDSLLFAVGALAARPGSPIRVRWGFCSRSSRCNRAGLPRRLPSETFELPIFALHGHTRQNEALRVQPRRASRGAAWILHAPGRLRP